ncbi:hypothetical protein SAMN06296952_1984 [Oscillospiraceae bacterium]|nr:hypothetical protein SAMN06296952_1984 [Oscillospiraceae bacterium]
MNRKDQYIEPDNSYYEPSTDTSHGTTMLIVVLTFVFLILTAVLAIAVYQKRGEDKANASVLAVNSDTYISVATATPTPVPPIQAFQNPLLYPATAVINTSTEQEIPSENIPSARGLTQNVINGAVIVTDYQRENEIFMGDPLEYSTVAGITTYRGNNFRNTASYGYLYPDGDSVDTITQVWEFSDTSSRLASSQNFEWSGFQLTGQPLVIRWDPAVKASMNLYSDKKSKADLTEVICACLDGYVYFFDIDDGTMTRDPIYVGASIKGTPAVDPRGWPLLYVGQADDNGDNEKFGMYIFSLIDGSELYFRDVMDDGAYRMNWGAFDSSPIVDIDSDTLIWPCENGIVYTFTLNTQYVSGGSSIMIDPVCTGYKYIFNDTQGRYLGVESSIAVYGNLGYFIDNNSNLICLDLNTFEMVWVFRTDDDSDLSPVLAEENGIPYLYIGTEVDYQGGQGSYNGAAYTYKLNALTGAEVWQTSQPCYTYNGQTSDTDQVGGCVGNPIVGKNSINNLVIFSYSCTNDLVSGNRLVAYNRDTGNEVWHYDMNIYTYSSPIDCYDQNGNAYIVIADNIGQIHLINGQTGERIAYIQTSRFLGTSSETTGGVEFQASPVIFNNMMIISTTSGSVFGIRID